MEGVTEPCFRALVLERNPPCDLGGAFTEFARVTDHPLSRRVLREHLGDRVFPQPVGLQLMGSDAPAMAETVRRAIENGAPLIDLNFGCPARGALRGCAGSALLDDPPAIEALVRACADAAALASGGRVPVTAKVRSGVEDDTGMEDIARAVAAGGARMLTVHCRTRREAYQDEVDWSRIARAVAAVDIPVCGNGGVTSHADLLRMRNETGCALVMVGRGALVDPWIFSGVRATGLEASEFLRAYADAMLARSRTGASGAARRLKQLFHHFAAGGLIAPDRASWLAERDPERLLARLRDPRSALHDRPLVS